jgi:hypothetical protein
MHDFEHLKKLLKMNDPGSVLIFKSKVDHLVVRNDPAILLQLIELFDDKCKSNTAMYSLLHAIETYPDEMYVKAIMIKIPKGLSDFPEWATRLSNRILNDDKCRLIFLENLQLVPKQDLSNLCDLIEQHYPKNIEIINELRNKLDNIT